MNAKSLALVAVRVLAVFIIIEAVSAVPFLFTSESSIADGASVLITIIGLSTVLLPMTLGIGLWFIGPLIARAAVAMEPTVSDSLPPTISNIQVIAFATLGAYLITVSIPALLGGIWRWAQSLDQPNLHQLFQVEFLVVDVSRIVLGLALVLGAGFFTRLCMRLRGFGLPPSA